MSKLRLAPTIDDLAEHNFPEERLHFPSDSPQLILHFCLAGVPNLTGPQTDQRNFSLYNDKGPAVDHLPLPPWYSETAQYVTRTCRSGPRVHLDSPDSQHRKESNLQQEIIRELVEARGRLLNARNEFNRSKQNIKIHVLETCLDLVREGNNQRPSVAKVIAALLLRPGLGGANGETFKACMRHLEFRARKRGPNPGIVPWDGDPSWYTRASSHAVTMEGESLNVLSAIILKVHQGEGNVSTLSELCEGIISTGTHLAFFASAALQIADILGIAKKWPLMLNPSSRQSESAWCSATHDPIKRQYPNVLIDILERAYAEPFDSTTLLSTNSDQPSYTDRTVNSALQLLRSNNLLEPKDPSSKTLIRITEKGRELIKFWVQTQVGQKLDRHEADLFRTTILELHKSNHNQEST